MRVTTQMVNESATKAGLPINNTSLLNYINGNGKNRSLPEALSKNKTAMVDTESQAKYEKLDKEADKLAQSIQVMLQEGDNNLFEQAAKSGDSQKIYDSIGVFFENYNSTLKAMKNISGTMNDFYRQMLQEAPKEVRESLESVGVTFQKDGMASVDKDKLKAADLKTLENLFGSKSEFMHKVQFISTRISDNAEANMDSLSSAYGSNGNLYSAHAGSKFDFLG